MSQQGAALNEQLNELVKCIEEMYSKRDELNGQINQEEEEKARLQNNICILTEKRDTFDCTIAETEAAYMKSSQTLLSVLKKNLET